MTAGKTAPVSTQLLARRLAGSFLMTTMLTAERLRELLHCDPETGIFTWLDTGRRGTGKQAGRENDKGYIRIGVDGRIYQASRLAFLYMTGAVPPIVDHRNTNPSDNRWNNLRAADTSKNNRNRSIDSKNTSGLKGVSWHKRDKRWRAYIYVDGKDVHLGYFDTAELAHAAYRRAADKHFGVFANYGANDNAKTEGEQAA